MTVYFCDRSFQISHMKAPRGFGVWGFFFDDDADPRRQNNPWFTRAMSFTDAKKAARAHAKANGFTFVAVAP